MSLPHTLVRLLVVGVAFFGLSSCAEDGADANGDQSCEPDTRECLDDFNFRVCDPNGQGYTLGVCPAGQPCSAGLCSGGAPNNDTPPNNNPPPPPNNDGNNDPPPPNNNPNNDVDDSTEGPCTPFERLCVNDGLLKICRGDGAAYDLGTCPPDQPCDDGFCGGIDGMPGTCTPGVRECIDARTIRICRPDGSAWDNQVCPNNFVCENAACRNLSNCIDNDQDGYGDGEGCLAPDCDDNDFSVNPDGFEICGNEIDEDCDGIDAPCECDPVAQDCPGDNLRCALGRNNDFECRTDGLLGEGELCGGIPSNCGRGLVCIITGGENESRCTRICDANSGQGCIGEAVCGATLNGFDNVGLCVGVTRCDPVDNPQACQPGTTCQPISDRDALCFDGGGNLGENANCNPNDDQCSSGLACITVQGGNNPGTRCKALCKINRGNGDCSNRQGQACSPIELSFTLNNRTETIRTYGICN